MVSIYIFILFKFYFITQKYCGSNFGTVIIFILQAYYNMPVI